MALRIFLLTWLLPLATWGQIGKSDPISALPAKQAPPLPRPTIEQALTGTVNVRIMELSTPTYLYRHLRDSSSRPAAWELKRGHFVIVRKAYPRWLAVQRAAGPTQFSGDTTTYYIPTTATRGSKTYIVL
jgi:hypothetical protein